MISSADILNAPVFKDFLPEDLDRIIHNLSEIKFPAGETIIHRGDPGYSLFIVLRGTVDITLTNDEGIEYPISTMGPGDNFGEMALMTGAPRSANVTAVTDVSLAELSQESFFELLSEYPKLVDGFLQQLAQRRGKNMVRQQIDHLDRAEIIANLFALQPPAIDCLLGSSKWTDDTNASINRLATTKDNILILGERGTGKYLAARLIHCHSQAKSRTIFYLNCASPPPMQRESALVALAGMDDLHMEIAQESALFGHGSDAGSYAKGIRKGYLELADGGTVILENINFLSTRVQHLLIQYLNNGTFVRIGQTQLMSSKVRIIATSSMMAEELKISGMLEPELLALVSGEILQMRPLRDRKKDIPVIAEYLVKEYSKKYGKNISSISKEALNYLVNHAWPLNVNEMRQVLERAVAIANSEVITERQVFLDLPNFSTTGKFNLLKIPFIRKLANNNFFPLGLRFVTVPFILALIVLTLIGPPQKNPANLVVWAIWWPFLIFSIFISARSWCGYCPMPVVSDFTNQFRNKFYPMPTFMAKYGVWIGIFGFAMILITEHASHMFTSARATSLLLISIIAGTTITNYFFGKRSWCKHICPLGRMVANSSAISLIELGSNSNVCSSQCHTQDCIKEGNCPMGIHPSAASVSKDCILCLSCLKRCKHQSVRVNLRFPWYEFFVKEKWNVPEAFFPVSLIALFLALKLPSWTPLKILVERQTWLGNVAVDNALSLSIGLLFIFSVIFASGFFSGKSWKNNFAVTGSAYLFLAFAALFNIYLHELVYHGQHLLPWILEMTGFGGNIPLEWITPELGTLKALVPLVTLISFLASFFLLTGLSSKYSLSAFVRRAHQGIMIITTIVFLAIL